MKFRKIRPRTMKKAMMSFISLTLAVIMALMNPVQTLASNTGETVYLSEIRVGMGKSSSEAANALEGYTIITDDKGNKVDFNSDAGGGWIALSAVLGVALGAIATAVYITTIRKKKESLA